MALEPELLLALAVLVGSVSAWSAQSLVRRVRRFFATVQAADTGVDGTATTLYLTAALGLTSHLTSARRIAYWRFAIQCTARQLRLRLRWHRLGLYLQSTHIQDNLSGIFRVKRRVIRTHNADSVSRPKAKAKARAQARQRTSASSESR
jgi:hypothetical protein